MSTLKDDIEFLVEGGEEMTLESRFDALGQLIIANSLLFMRKAVNKTKITPEEIEEQDRLVKSFNEIEKVMGKLKKANRLSGSSGAFNKDLLKTIKERNSSIAGIVISNVNNKE